METLKKSRGIHGDALRTWGLLIVAAGLIGRGILQNGILKVGELSGEQLLEKMGSSSGMMVITSLALVIQAMETCAIPVFAMLLLEGMEHTSSVKKYMLRVLGLAVLAEVPFDMAVQGKFWDLHVQNPVFGVLLCLIVLYFYRRYPKHLFAKIIVALAGFVWVNMMHIQFGGMLLAIVLVFWGFRDMPMYRTLAGVAAAAMGSIASPFYLAAPLGFILIHFYNGEKGTTPMAARYLAYPVIALVTGIIAMLL